MSGVWAFLVAHWGVISLTAVMAATAISVTMPTEPPRSFAELWHWFYDAVHQFANLKNSRPTLPG